MMNLNPIAFNDWLCESAAGHYASSWQQQRYDAAVTDIFGYYALEIGAAPIKALQSSRIQHTWHVGNINPPSPADQLCAAAEALPFESEQFDLVVMPHGLELSHQPQVALREACRVLRPEGRLLISGFNPARLLGNVRPSMHKEQLGKAIGFLRLRDWLNLLCLEVQQSAFGCYLPNFKNQQWYARMAWLDRLAAKPAPYLGGLYWLAATKKVHGAQILAPTWKRTNIKESKTSVAINHHQRPLIKRLDP